ncbi:MAG: hypothetical protein IPJ34_36845 [Myxococcales bacterium]|nr:hypothetical protein [Myxococcales bacterium]
MGSRRSAAPPAPKLPRKKLAGKPSLDHDCLEPDTIFEPMEVVVDGAQVLFRMHVCEEVGFGWARWSSGHKQWLPADDPSDAALVQDYTVTLSGGVLTAGSKLTGPPLPVRLPDERARVLRWRTIGDTLWVVSSFRDEGSETTIHVSLATSAP